MKNVGYILSKAYHSIKDDRRAKTAVVWLWILGIGYYVVGMLMPLAQSALLDGAAALIGTQTSVSWQLILGIVGMVVFTFYKTNYYVMTKCRREIADQTICTRIQSSIYSKMCTISYSHFNSPKIYDDIQTLSGRFASFCSNFLAGPILTSLIGTIISFVFTSIMLFTVSPFVALLMIAGNALGIFKTCVGARLNYYNVVQNMRERRFADSYINPIFERSFIKEVRLYGLYDYLTNKWHHYTNRVNARTVRYNILFSLLDFLTYGLSYAFLIASLVLTAVLIFNGECSIGSFLLVYSSSGSLIDTSGNLFNTFKEIKLASYYVQRHKSFEALPDVEPLCLIDVSVALTDMNIVFDNVSFTYEDEMTPALNNINLTIKQGEKVAIVGKNGCGKTTLVSLLDGLYIPTTGKITIGGHPCEEVLTDLRLKCSTLFQDFGTYETTIRENITMSSIDGVLSDDELQLICENSGLLEWIDTLPNGIDTPIGRFAEDGIDLSGGQWQRIAIARLMARKDRRIVIMDEPTSSLDPIAEATIYKDVLANVRDDETLILISHRLGAIKYVDRIIVMENGSIIEEGSHIELMEKRGKYYDMYSMQTKWYM